MNHNDPVRINDPRPGPVLPPATSISAIALLTFWGVPNVTLADSASATDIAEVRVTAQKTDERLQDVPVPVSVLEAARLVNSHQLRLQDYTASVPGLTVGLASVTFQSITIRGVSGSTSTNPKVGVLIDDVPFGGSTLRGGGLYVPDIDPDDLSRIEVLRGPQGTLYGAGSLGGLIKYVTADPSLDGIHGRGQIGLTSVAHGSDPGYSVRGSLNVPLSDTFAFSASAFKRDEPGYIDNLETGEKDFNEQHVKGGRVAALWRPSEDTSLKMSALYQDYKGDGPNEIALQPGTMLPINGDLQIPYMRGVGQYSKELQLYSATFDTMLGNTHLTSVTGYGRLQPMSTQDFRTGAPYNTLAATQFGVTGVLASDGRHFRKFSQELRLSVPLGEKLEWLVGGFYTSEKVGQFNNTRAVDPNTGAVVGDLLLLDIPSDFKERAGFTDLTYHFTDRLDLQVGARRSDFDNSVQFTYTGPFVPAFLALPSPLVLPQTTQKAQPTTFLVTPRFRFSDDLMMYARVASGYGAGGTTISPTSGAFRPFGPEKTRNYELGAKGDFFDHRLAVDLSIYHIDYDDIQVSLRDAQSGLTFTGNGGAAKSQGVELSVSSRPLTGLALNGWVAYNDAVLTEALPNQAPITSTVTGNPGDRLPNANRWSGYVSLEQAMPLSNAVSLTAGASMSYVGERIGIFTNGTPRREYPSYTKTDVYARAMYDSWTLNVFVNNVTDKRGVVWGDVRGTIPTLFEIQPRTLGLSVTKEF